jgi:ABC-2 type transport system ATP-binding protein
MISIKNLHFSYKKKKVFQDFSLELTGGYIYGLLGSNGTGKSTLLKTIAGLLFPKSGTIQVLGMLPEKRSPNFLNRIFLLPEEFYTPNITTTEFVDCYASFYPLFNEEQFQSYLEEFEVPIENKIGEMSYGQKKKVLISFTLACNTEIMLMDEPTNGLDIVSKSTFRKLIASAMQENKCIIISTHQVKDLENLIDRVTIIDSGEILFDKTVTEIGERLDFKLVFTDNENMEILYQENSIKGNAVIVPNHSNEESRIDLEMLYKAIMLAPEKINQQFLN